MNYSVNNSVPFSAINWSSFENRPEIKDSMIFCTEENWDQNVKCCMDGYSIEQAIEESANRGRKRAGIKFLDQYPCVNGPELESIAYSLRPTPSGNSSDITPTPLPESPPTNNDNFCDSRAINAFLKFVNSVHLDNTVEISRLKQGVKISCDALIDMVVRYGRASQ